MKLLLNSLMEDSVSSKRFIRSAQNAMGGSVPIPTAIMSGQRCRIDRAKVSAEAEARGVRPGGKFIVFLDPGSDVQTQDLFEVVRPDGTVISGLRVKSVWSAALLGMSHMEIEVEPINPGRE